MSQPFPYTIFEAEPDTWFYLRHAFTFAGTDLPEVTGGPYPTLDDAADGMVVDCGNPGDICGVTHQGFTFLPEEKREELLRKVGLIGEPGPRPF